VTVKLWPLTDDSGGTCDWGRCDGESVALRRDPGSGVLLPVCQGHTGQQRPSAGRGACPVCGKDTALSTVGKVRAHDRAFATRCPGSGGDPR
jgi:hypothetical protein